MPLTAPNGLTHDIELTKLTRAAGQALWWYQDHGGEEYLLDWESFERLALCRMYCGVPKPEDLARWAANGPRWTPK